MAQAPTSSCFWPIQPKHAHRLFVPSGLPPESSLSVLGQVRALRQYVTEDFQYIPFVALKSHIPPFESQPGWNLSLLEAHFGPEIGEMRKPLRVQ